MKKRTTLALLLAVVIILSLPTAFSEDGGEANDVLGMSIKQAAGGTLPSDQETEDFNSAPYIPDGLERVIIGEDNRTIIKSPAEFPYSAIAYLETKHSCGCSGESTGFMVSKNTLMTAAHCIICQNHGGKVTKMTMYFGYKSKKNYLAKYSGKFDYWYGTDFSNGDGTYRYGGHDPWDYAYLKLEKDIGNKTGWFGLSSVSDASLMTKQLELAGYRNGKLYSGHDTLRGVDNQLIELWHGAEPGQSGSPLFDTSGYAYGFWVSYYTEDVKNFAYRINRWLIDEMRDKELFD